MSGLSSISPEAHLVRCQVTAVDSAVNLTEIAARRCSTWWLLSRLVMELPQEPWLGELEGVLAAVEPHVVTPLGSESAALLRALREARSQSDGPTALAIDRTRLLAGILQDVGVVAPFESAARGVPMNSDLVSDVVACYVDAELDEVGHKFGPPDFLGTELRFMALLVYREMQAYQASDTGLARQWLSRQRNFFDRHLLQWVPAQCERLSAAATTAFYAALGVLLGRACVLDRADVTQLVDWLETGMPIGCATDGNAS